MKEIESLTQKFRTSVFEKDIETFISLFHEKVLIFDLWQQWTYNGLPAWREMVKGWFESLGTDSDVVTFDEIQIQSSGELASLTAIVKFTAVSEKGEELRFLQNRLTWIIRKKENQWKIIHQHTSSPIDFNSMKVILTK